MVQLLKLKRRNLIKTLSKGSFGILAMGGLSGGNFKDEKQKNGSVAAKKLLLYHGCQLDGMIMPDHIPYHEDPASSLQGHAYAFGYNKALLQVVEKEG